MTIQWPMAKGQAAVSIPIQWFSLKTGDRMRNGGFMVGKWWVVSTYIFFIHFHIMDLSIFRHSQWALFVDSGDVGKRWIGTGSGPYWMCFFPLLQLHY